MKKTLVPFFLIAWTIRSFAYQIQIGDIAWYYFPSGDGYQIDSYGYDPAAIRPTSYAGDVVVPSVIAGKQVVSVASGSFRSCPNITSITYPENCGISVSSTMFDGCSSLKKVYVPASFDSSNMEKYVPSGCKVVHYPISFTVSSLHGVTSFSDNAFDNRPFDEVSATVSSVDVVGGNRYVCTGWNGTGSAPANGDGTNCTFVIKEPSTLTWNWKTQALVSVSTTGGECTLDERWADLGQTETGVLKADSLLFGISLSGDTNGVVLDDMVLSVPVDGPRSINVSFSPSEGDNGVETGAPLQWRGVGSSGGWRVVDDETADDGKSLKSGTVDESGTAFVEAFVDQAGTITFEWRVSCGQGCFARFYLDGTIMNAITKSPQWTTVSHSLDDGPHALRWSYEKGSGSTAGDDAAFLDNVRWSPLSLEQALDATNLVWTTDGDSAWIPQVSVSDDGEDAAKSGPVTGGKTSVLSTTVRGAGILAWRWKADVTGSAGVTVRLDERNLDGSGFFLEASSDWTGASLEIEDAGEHDVAFEFRNGGTEATSSDCVYVDRVSWTPSKPDSIAVAGFAIPVSWLDAHAAVFVADKGGDYEEAAKATSSNGVDKVWQCYVAGLSPTNATDRLLATIEVKDGEPTVGWTPDLGAEREYAVDGKRVLSDKWGVQNSECRFFRVRATMPGGFGTYTIAFDSDGGSDVMPITAVCGAAVTAPESPTKPGFDFLRWIPPVPETMPIGGATVSARWRPRKYTIAFDTDGGSAVAPITAAYGSALTAPANPTKDGYDFAGWSPALPATMPLGGATLVAQWIPDYTITFDTNGGSAVAPITAACGSALTPPAPPVKDGYTFLGWSPAFPETMPFGGARLVARWRYNDPLSEALDTTLVFVRGGNAFWLAESDETHDGVSAARSGSISNSQDTWIETTVNGPGTISFWWNVSSEGASYDWLEFCMDGTQKAKIGGKSGEWEQRTFTVSGDGEHVLRWNYRKNGSGTSGSDCGWLDEVVWTPNPYTLRFDANGGTGRMDDIECSAGDSNVSLPPCGFSREGWFFVGWARSADGAVEWTDGETVSGGLSGIVSGGVATVFARWSRGTYAVQFNANDGTGSMSNATLWFDMPQTLPPSRFTKDRFWFAGWSTNETDEAAFTDGATVRDLAPIGAVATLRAVWTETPVDNLVCAQPFDESICGFSLRRGIEAYANDRYCTGDGAFRFDGSTNLHDDSVAATNSFTIAFWVKPENDVQMGLSQSNYGVTAANSTLPFVVFPNHAGNSARSGVGVAVGRNGIAVVEHSDSWMPIPLLQYANYGEAWIHVAVTMSNNGAPTLYVNGQFVKQGLSTSREKNVNLSSGLGGDASANQDRRSFKGSVDDFFIFDRALSDEEVGFLFRYGL